ncbi:MAG: helix-turn-helix transcriptional regulator [Bacteroidales bacterium]|nr:helix-turn-helix transcriptional regulator [Bacteroidales bacterium]
MAKLNRIRVVLAERDLNNKWLADKLGKDQATVSKWITNTTQPNLETMMQIARVLETPVDDLLRFEELPEILSAEETV